MSNRQAVSDPQKRPPLLSTLLWLGLAALLTIFGLGGDLKALGFVCVVGVIPDVLLGLLVAVAVCGPRGAAAGFRFLVGRGRESEYPLAAHAIGAGGAFLMNLSICGGYVILLANLDLVRSIWEGTQHGEPYTYRAPLNWSYGLPLPLAVALMLPVPLAVGRFVLGAAGELAASRAGIAAPRFPLVAQFALVLSVILGIGLLFLEFPTVGD